MSNILEKIDMDKVKVTIDIGIGLIKAGNTILELLKKDNDLSDIEILELIEMHDQAKNNARSTLIDSIKRRKSQDITNT